MTRRTSAARAQALPSWLGLLLLLALAALVWGLVVAPERSPASLPAPATVAAGFAAGAVPAVAVTPENPPADGLATIAFAQLPRQGRETIQLIEAGGPFPYRQDGAVFQNRERLLPRQASGYYHEYTVETPGSDDRGARRIIAGAAGELYYTADHYASFKRVIR